jgi:hypothetical protein
MAQVNAKVLLLQAARRETNVGDGVERSVAIHVAHGGDAQVALEEQEAHHMQRRMPGRARSVEWIHVGRAHHGGGPRVGLENGLQSHGGSVAIARHVQSRLALLIHCSVPG